MVIRLILPFALFVLLAAAGGVGADQSSPPHRSPPATIGTHATKGVVKSIDDKTLVLSRGAGQEKDLRFALNGNTQRSGTVAVGATVEVRYRIQGKQRIATAISADAHRK